MQSFLEPRLSERGFVSTKPGKWVKESSGFSHQVIEIEHYKGAISAPVWGFSLNYTPHFNNSFKKLSWHRTVKSARLDVFPFDEFGDELNVCRFASAIEHQTTVANVFRTALGRANTFFESISSCGDLLPVFERLKADRRSRLGYWNYTSIPVAHAFTLHVNDRTAEGKSILDEYIRRMNVPEHILDDLWRRFEQAKV